MFPMKTMIHQCGFLIGIVCCVALCASDSRQRTGTRTEEADVVRLRGKVENERIEELLEALIEEKEEEEEKKQRDEREQYNYYDDDADAVAPPANEGANDASAGGGVAPPAADTAGGGGGGGHGGDTAAAGGGAGEGGGAPPPPPLPPPPPPTAGGTGGGATPGGPVAEGAPVSGKTYLIVSKFAGGKVIEMKPNGPLAGAKIQLWDKRDVQDKTQLWITDSNGYVRSAFDSTMEFCDSSKVEDGKTRRVLDGRRVSLRFGDLTGLEMHAANSGHKGGNWKWGSHGQIVNGEGYALTIANAVKDNGGVLIQHTTNEEDHKVWSFQYTSPSRRQHHSRYSQTRIS